jgi:hypothetical protein
MSVAGNKKAIIILVALALLIAGAVSLAMVWFYSNFEKVPYEVTLGISAEARKNPLLAAHMYLEDQAYTVESKRGMDLLVSLPSHEDAIVIRQTPAGMSGGMTDKIMDWVERGGHLLLVPNFSESDHPGARSIVQEVGARYREYEEKDYGGPDDSDQDAIDETDEVSEKDVTHQDENPKEDVTSDEEEESSDDYWNTDSLIDLRIEDHDIILRYSNNTLLEDYSTPADFRVNGSYRVVQRKKKDGNNEEKTYIEEEDAWLLQYNRGAGKITVLSELTPFLNDNIGDYDHAFFLSWLIGDVEKVWLLHSLKEKSLFAFLWDSFQYFWMALILTLVLIFWRMQKITGSRYPLQKLAQRNILAHIDATGLFCWRLDMCLELVENNRNLLFNRWVSTKLGNRQLKSEAETLAWMAEKTGVSQDEIELAFRYKVANEQDLIRVSREMMKIHNKIQGGEH